MQVKFVFGFVFVQLNAICFAKEEKIKKKYV